MSDEIDVDSRPSDALNLAVRFGAPFEVSIVYQYTPSHPMSVMKTLQIIFLAQAKDWNLRWRMEAAVLNVWSNRTRLLALQELQSDNAKYSNAAKDI